MNAFRRGCLLWLFCLQLHAQNAVERCPPGSACWAQRQTTESMGQQTQRISSSLDEVATRLPQFAVLAKNMSDLNSSFSQMGIRIDAGLLVEQADLNAAIRRVNKVLAGLEEESGRHKTEFRQALQDARLVMNNLESWLQTLKTNQYTRVELSSVTRELDQLSESLKTPIKSDLDSDTDPDAQQAGINRRQIDPTSDLRLFYPGLQILTVRVVGVPDPRVPKTQRNFDLVLIAIHRALEVAGYRFDRYAFPWQKDGLNEVPLPAKEVTQQLLKSLQKKGEAYPKTIFSGLTDFGLITFANTDRTKVVALYLVAERASQGPHLNAVVQALLVARLQFPPFSLPMKSRFESRTVNGSCVSDNEPIQTIAFYPESNSTWESAISPYADDCVIGLIKATDAQKPAIKRDAQLIIALPPNIYQIRAAGEAPAGAELSAAARKDIPMRRLLWRQRNELDLAADLGNEWPESYATSTTARTLDLWLDQQLDKLANRDRVVIKTENVLDQIFLTRRIRERQPEIKIVIVGADILFAHPSFLSSTRRALVLGNLERQVGGETYQFSNDESAQMFCKILSGVSAKLNCGDVQQTNLNFKYWVTRHGLRRCDETEPLECTFYTNNQAPKPSLREKLVVAALTFALLLVVALFCAPRFASSVPQRYLVFVTVACTLTWMCLLETNIFLTWIPLLQTDEGYARTLLFLPGIIGLMIAFSKGNRIFLVFVCILMFATCYWLLKFERTMTLTVVCATTILFAAVNAVREQRHQLEELLAGMPGDLEGLSYVGHPLLPTVATPFLANPDSARSSSPILGLGRLRIIRRDVGAAILRLRSLIFIGMLHSICIGYACYLFLQDNQNALLMWAVAELFGSAFLLWYVLVSFEKDTLLSKIFCKGVEGFHWSGVIVSYLLLPLIVFALLFFVLMQPGTTIIQEGLSAWLP